MPDFSEILKANAEQMRKERERKERHVEELRTANLIAAYNAIGGMGSDWAMKERQKLRELIWKRLGL